MSECKEIIQNKLCLNVKKSYKTSYVLMLRNHTKQVMSECK